MGNHSGKLSLIIEFKFVNFSLLKCGSRFDFTLLTLFENYCLGSYITVPSINFEFTLE